MKVLSYSIFLTFFILKVQFIHSYTVGVGYNYYDRQFRSFNHGSVDNERTGGTCAEFLQLNGINQCCAQREDDCYMLHYDTRCYCDNFCDRPHSDCCPDAGRICGGYVPPEPPSTPRPTPPQIVPNYDCNVHGQRIRDGERFRDNCNECTCINGQVTCTQEPCVVDVKLLSDVNNDPRIGWEAGNYSIFWGKPLDYAFKRRLGTKLPIQRQKAFDPYAHEDRPEITIPERYDFREDPEVRNYLRRHPIRDQGDCAASWAFSTIDVATDRLMKVSKGRHGNQTEYSVQMLLSCAILRDDKANGCQPSTTDVAWNYLNHITSDAGVVEENCWPYSNANKESADQCLISAQSVGRRDIICPESRNRYDGSLLLASPVYPLKVQDEDDIKREILIQGPVQAIFRVYSDFFMYKRGVYQWSRKAPEYDHRDPYHSVKILGWGTENGVDYWLCANSWGEQWGENGYFKIKRGDCEINDHIFAAWGNSKVNGKLAFNHRALMNRVQSMYLSI